MRLTDLHPTLEPGGRSETERLTFDCPTCGPAHRVEVLVWARLPRPPIWQKIPAGADFGRMSVNPSISAACGWHGTIHGGEVRGA